MQEFDYEIEYIKDSLNTVPDALSRKHKEVHRVSSEIVKKLLSLTFINMSDDTIKSLEKQYETDDYFSPIRKESKEPFKKK